MDRRSVKVKADAGMPVVLPHGGRVVAIVVGLEEYQARSSGKVPKVDYAGNDAEEFAAALKLIYPEDRLVIELLKDSGATLHNLRYTLRMAINSLESDDLFIFYYAGHGFHGPGGNRITGWETHPFDVEDTTLLLRDVLTEPLADSACHRALAFVDACASDFAGVVKTRDIVGSLNGQELAAFLDSAKYSAMFLACEPGQKSYPSSELRHGVWTYFLLKALRGEAEEALAPGRFLTDVTLRDYLRQQVPRYVTRHMQVRGNQTPYAMVLASNTFAIRHVPAPTIAIAPAGDLSSVRTTAKRDYLEGVERGAIKSLDGFDKRKGHFEPEDVNTYATSFVQRLLVDRVNDEIQNLYEATKSAFALRRKDISQKSGGGGGSLDTEFFRFSIETRQHRVDPADYVIVRRLELREDPEIHQAEIDEVFGRIFRKIVVEVDTTGLDFDDLVEFFENVQEAHGGALKDEEALGRVTYTASDGTRIKINIERGRISLEGPRDESYSKLIARARQYKFGLSGQSRLLLS